MEETYSKLNSTHKIVVTMLQQLVTECAGLGLATQPCTLASATGYRVYRLVLVTQPCTLASTTGYRVYRLVLVTQPCTLASTTGYRVYRLVLVTQPCTLASTTGYRVYGWYWLHSLVHLLQQLVT